MICPLLAVQSYTDNLTLFPPRFSLFSVKCDQENPYSTVADNTGSPAERQIRALEWHFRTLCRFSLALTLRALAPGTMSL